MEYRIDKYVRNDKDGKYYLEKRITTETEHNKDEDLKPIRKMSWYVNGVKLPNIVDVKLTPYTATFTIEAGLSQVEYK